MGRKRVEKFSSIEGWNWSREFFVQSSDTASMTILTCFLKCIKSLILYYSSFAFFLLPFFGGGQSFVRGSPSWQYRARSKRDRNWKKSQKVFFVRARELNLGFFRTEQWRNVCDHPDMHAEVYEKFYSVLLHCLFPTVHFIGGPVIRTGLSELAI